MDDILYNLTCGVLFYAFLFGIIGLFIYGMSGVAKQEYAQKQQEEKEQVEKYGLFGKRDTLPIEGHPEFVSNIERVLEEAKDRAPHRYEEVIKYFPKAKYEPGYGYDGRADGLFSIDGTGNIPTGGGYYKVNTFEHLRFCFWHEVGHCVKIHYSHDHSEESANNYANDVLRELGV